MNLNMNLDMFFLQVAPPSLAYLHRGYLSHTKYALSSVSSVNNCVVFTCCTRGVTLSKLVSHSFAGVLTINQLNLNMNLDMFCKSLRSCWLTSQSYWLTQKSQNSQNWLHSFARNRAVKVSECSHPEACTSVTRAFRFFCAFCVRQIETLCEKGNSLSSVLSVDNNNQHEPLGRWPRAAALPKRPREKQLRQELRHVFSLVIRFSKIIISIEPIKRGVPAG